MNNNTYQIRKILPSDYFQFHSLISQLKPTQFSNTQFNHLLSSLHDNHNIFVLLDSTQKILASITFILEKKFIHNMGSCLHLEDLIVHSKFRKLGIASQLILFTIQQFKSSYKIILNCSPELIPFYSKIGFKKNAEQMAIYQNI